MKLKVIKSIIVKYNRLDIMVGNKRLGSVRFMGHYIMVKDTVTKAFKAFTLNNVEGLEEVFMARIDNGEDLGTTESEVMSNILSMIKVM